MATGIALLVQPLRWGGWTTAEHKPIGCLMFPYRLQPSSGFSILVSLSLKSNDGMRGTDGHVSSSSSSSLQRPHM